MVEHLFSGCLAWQALVVTHVVAVVLGGGFILLYDYVWGQDFNPEKVLRRLLRKARALGLQESDFKNVHSTIDLRGSRLMPLRLLIQQAGIPLETSTELIDRMKMVLFGEVADSQTGQPHSGTANRFDPILDATTRKPGISQPGQPIDNG